MLRQGSVGLLRQTLQQHILQQPVQQSCVQLQVPNLQAVRFRSKPSNPKFRQSLSRADRAKEQRHHALERAIDKRGLLPFGATAGQAEDAVVNVPGQEPPAPPAAAAATADSSTAATPADSSSKTAADGSSSSSSSSWAPSWLRGLVGENQFRRSRPPPAQASPLTPKTAFQDLADKQADEEKARQLQENQAAAAKEKKKAAAGEQQQQQQGEGAQQEAAAAEAGSQAEQPKQEDGWDSSMQAYFKDYSLDDHANLIRNDPDSDDYSRAPRPRTPSRGPRAFRGEFDAQRAWFKKTATQEEIIRALDSHDKLRIKLDPNIHKDQDALRELADKTGFWPDAVRDLVVTFHKYKLEFRLMYEYRNGGGKMPPFSNSEKVDLLKRKLQLQHEQKKVKELLAGRDVKACELKHFDKWVGKAHMRRICPQTELPYSMCCGRNNRLNHKALRKDRRAMLLSAA